MYIAIPWFCLEKTYCCFRYMSFAKDLCRVHSLWTRCKCICTVYASSRGFPHNDCTVMLLWTGRSSFGFPSFAIGNVFYVNDISKSSTEYPPCFSCQGLAMNLMLTFCDTFTSHRVHQALTCTVVLLVIISLYIINIELTQWYLRFDFMLGVLLKFLYFKTHEALLTKYRQSIHPDNRHLEVCSGCFYLFIFLGDV